jgi:hypothetical protein
LENVCPNCGGGFCRRPIRPSRNWKNGNFLDNNPPSSEIKYKPVDFVEHQLFASEIKIIPPNER